MAFMWDNCSGIGMGAPPGELSNVSSCCPHYYPVYPLKGVPENYVVPIQGYLSPILVFLTLINNSLVCLVLLKPHMRSPTTALLVAIAISDLLTGIFPVPVYLHFFSSERYRDYVPYEWCAAYNYLSGVVPTIFHTASIWLTMALAIQRYIHICHPFRARTWCRPTIDKMLRVTAVIYVVALLSQVSQFFEYDYTPYETPSFVNPNVSVTACCMIQRGWVQQYENVYYSIYWWFRVVFIHLVPCCSLVVMNALLIYSMRSAQLRRMQLLRQNKKSESKKLKDSDRTTLMLVVVVGLFLLVELPIGILLIIHIVSYVLHSHIFSEAIRYTTALFFNFFIHLSYPINFFIYCGMSKQFRETFRRLFTGGEALPVEREYSQYMTLPTENGKTNMTGDETAL